MCAGFTGKSDEMALSIPCSIDIMDVPSGFGASWNGSFMWF